MESDMSNVTNTEMIREFVIAGHGNFERVKAMLAEHPELLNMSFEWKPDDTETALQGASHVGNRAIAEYLLAQGAPLHIYTAAMLGQREVIEQFLADDPALIQAHGAHGIPLLTHAAFSGDVPLVAMLYEHGAREGASSALSVAVSKGHVDLARWLLANGDPDPSWQNFQGKTALDLARERGDETLIALLSDHATSTGNKR
jgi:ankyrin repeat protein